MKDYYHTLRISPTASTEEVKKAFRKLALKYHPDKQDNSAVSGAHFAEIYEAYAVLSDAAQRAAYNRRRTDPLFTGVLKVSPSSAADIVTLSEQLKKKLSLLDPFRSDRDLLEFEMSYLLSPANLDILALEPNTQKQQAVVRNIIHSGSVLPYSSVISFKTILLELSKGDEILQRQVVELINGHRRQRLWDRYKIWIALTVALVFCLLLFRYGKR